MVEVVFVYEYFIGKNDKFSRRRVYAYNVLQGLIEYLLNTRKRFTYKYLKMFVFVRYNNNNNL